MEMKRTPPMLDSRRRARPLPFRSRRNGSRWSKCAALSLLVLVFPCLGPGCSAEGLRLYCGAGIRPPVAELVEEFESQHDLTIVCDYRGSEVMLSSIKLTGKGDLYMPGDVHYVEQAEKEGLIASKKTVCYFVPVILVQPGNPKEIHTLKDLLRDDVRVGLGDPKACAIGPKSLMILAKNGISKEDVKVTFWSPTVSELANHIKVGSLDAVIVWDAVAAYIGDQGEIVPIPASQNIISTVAVGILKSSQHPEAAAKFVEFITSERGREVFEKYHYTTTMIE